MKLISISIIFFSLSALVLSCKSYYNDMIRWTDSIPVGTSLDSVKKLQPNFIEIAWDKPTTGENEKSFDIIKIKGNSDLLNMQNYLTFKNDRYIGRFARK